MCSFYSWLMSLHSLYESPSWLKREESLFLLTSTLKLEKMSLTRLTHALIAEWIQYPSEFVWNLEAGMRLTKELTSESRMHMWLPLPSFLFLTCLFWIPCCHPTDVFVVFCRSQTLLALPGDPTNPQCSISGALGRETDGRAVHSATQGDRWRRGS